MKRIELTENFAIDKRASFEIDPACLIMAEKRDRAGEEQLIGYFHSHPGGTAIPSTTDAAMAAEDGRYWVIVGENRVTAWKLAPNKEFREQEVTVT